MGGVETLSGDECSDVRSVREVAILDAEPLTGAYDAFHQGDAVFTSLGFSGGDPRSVDSALERLFERNITCVFIKDTFPYDPHERVLQASRKRKIPLFRYSSGLLEQIITEARDLIALAEQEDKTEQELRTLVNGLYREGIAREFSRITGLTGDRVQALMLAVSEGDRLTLSALCSHVSEQLKTTYRPEDFRVIRLDGNALILLALAQGQQPLDEERARALIAGFGSRAYAGCSEALPAGDVALTLQEAAGCLSSAAERGRSALGWRSLGPDAFSAACRSSLLMQSACESGLARLRAWDCDNHGDLEQSMRAYVAAGGRTEDAASLLSQHPNSMRNRLARARSVLSLAQATDKEFFAYLAMLFL